MGDKAASSSGATGNYRSMLLTHAYPKPFTGTRDTLKLNIWLYKLNQYFKLASVHGPIADSHKISFTCLLLEDSAMVWWLSLEQAKTAPDTWEGFQACIRKEFCSVGD